MLKLTFYPESDQPEFIEAAQQYQKIWDKDGRKIAKTMEKMSKLKFVEKFINTLVFEGISSSHPLRLRASYPDGVKKATLIHELGHRLISGNELNAAPDGRKLDNLASHQLLNLILYDVWVDLYGEKFAEENVRVESERVPFYEEAWKWALSFDKGSRIKKFGDLIAEAQNNEGVAL